MEVSAFLDTNVFLFAFEYPESNSANIIKLLNEDMIKGIISTQVTKGGYNYFKKHYSKELADKFRKYLIESCIIIPRSMVLKEMNRIRNNIKAKDLEQIAVAKKLNLKYLISYDRDFEMFSEYFTQKRFLEEIGEEILEREY